MEATTVSTRTASDSILVRTVYFGSSDDARELPHGPPTQRTGGRGSLGLSSSQAAKALGVTESTIRRWVDAGYLEPYRTTGGQLLISADQLQQFLVELQRSTRGARVAAPSLRDVAGAISQTERYLRSAELLVRTSPPNNLWARWQADVPHPELTVAVAPAAAARYHLTSVRMQSPLEVILDLPPVTWTGIGLGLVLLAERICTFGPRVSRKRSHDLLEAARSDAARQDLLAGRADGLALTVLADGPAHGPDHIDFLDPSASDDVLVPLEADQK